MIRKSLFVCTALIIAFSLLVSCNGETPVKEYTVTFNSNGGSEVSAVMVKAGEKAAEPENPSQKVYSMLQTSQLPLLLWK